MNDYLKLALAALLIGGLGYAAGRYVQPAKVEIKKEVEVKEVEVTRKNIVTVTHEEKRPDGTVITDSRTEDKSTEATRTDTKSKESTTITNVKPQWKVSGGAGVKYNEISLQPVYTVGVERRILGPIFVGAYGRTDKEVGLSVSVEF